MAVENPGSKIRFTTSVSGNVNVRGGVVTPSAVQVYRPPPITSFGDRATNAIHTYPLQKGIGNNPTDLPSYIRQNAN